MGEKEEKSSNPTEELLKKIYEASNSNEFSDYTRNTQFFNTMPENQFSHAWLLLNNPRNDPKSFSDLLDPQMFLGNVGDAKSLRFYQIDYQNIVQMFSMAKNDPVMRYIFEPIYNSLIGEIRLTSVMDGSERSYQAFHVPMRKGKSGGFHILSKKKEKREPIEYLMPNEEDEGIY